MYVCWYVHQDTYLDIWVGWVIIRCQDNWLCCFANLVMSLVLSQLLSSGFTSDFCLHPSLPLVFYSTSFLSNLIMIPLAIYLLAPVCLYPRHSFLCMFMIQFYRYMCAHPCTPSSIRITTCWGVLTPLDPHVQVLKLGACGFPQLL